MRVLLTGMSGSGKSTLVAELRRRGLAAVDVDDDGLSRPGRDGRWDWDVDAVRALLEPPPRTPLLLAGCSEAQGALPFDRRVVLVVPREVLVERLRTRTTNAYGRDPDELAQVLDDLEAVQPLLLRSADHVLDGTRPPAQLATQLLGALGVPPG